VSARIKSYTKPPHIDGMQMRSLALPLWRTVGGVFGVSALIGVAYAIGWLQGRFALMPA